MQVISDKKRLELIKLMQESMPRRERTNIKELALQAQELLKKERIDLSKSDWFIKTYKKKDKNKHCEEWYIINNQSNQYVFVSKKLCFTQEDALCYVVENEKDLLSLGEIKPLK